MKGVNGRGAGLCLTAPQRWRAIQTGTPGVFDDLIHQPVRLRLMIVLDRDGQPADFVTLRAQTQATDGNLGSHLTALEKAGYVEIIKDFLHRRPRTRAAVTAKGRAALRGHLAELRALIDQVDAIEKT